MTRRSSTSIPRQTGFGRLLLLLLAVTLLLVVSYIFIRPMLTPAPALPVTPTAEAADQFAPPEPSPTESGFEAGVVAVETPAGHANPTATATRRPTRTPVPTVRATRTPRATATPADRLPIIAFADLPRQAQDTIRLIDQGGPFPYRQDGTVFQNRERLLPGRSSGYYREYTVVTPGESDRGARRIIAGAGGELYYTADHYASFKRVVR